MRGWLSRGSKWKDGETADHVLQALGCPQGSLQIASETFFLFFFVCLFVVVVVVVVAGGGFSMQCV